MVRYSSTSCKWTRLYEHLGGSPIYLHRVGADDPTAEVSVRYRLATK